MTPDEAAVEARRRWGPRARVEVRRTGETGTLHSLFVDAAGGASTGLGQGSSWEEAFADAESREWKLSHPFNLQWLFVNGSLFLDAECWTCKVRSQHRVTPQAPFTKPDWLQRAESAEAALLKRLQVDDRWQACPHRGGLVRPDRADVLKAARPRK